MEHPERARVAEIIVGRSGKEDTRGSGYLVSAGWVLTACHVVRDAASIGVWLGAPPELVSQAGVGVDIGRVLTLPAADLALLPLGSRMDDSVCEPVRFGRLDRDPGLPVPAATAGCPRFKLRPAPSRPDVLLRELEYAIGTIASLSDAKTDRFAFAVKEPGPDPEPDTHSPWEGMSGAAVWASGRLIGVVGQHYPREGLATLTVCPVEELFHCASAAELEAWRAAAPRLPSTAGSLSLATPPTVRKIEERRARQAAEALVPRLLIGRREDLASLEAFIGSGERWRWIQGDAFAGKTALLAWFTLHPPERVDVVACFLRRAGGSNSASYALDVLNRQLALLAHRDSNPNPLSVSDQIGDFADLMEEAARACAERSRALLMLIDGLDEYDRTTSRLDLADWLPDDSTLPDQAMLAVTSRTGTDVRLTSGHPLLGHVQRLAASEVATGIQHAANAELSDVFETPDRFIYRLLCFLTVAEDGLTVSELRALMKRRSYDADIGEIRVQLRSSLGRSLMSLPDPDLPSASEANGPRVFVFAHDTLLAEARRQINDDLSTYEGVFDEWAEEYIRRGWPTDTPRYLLRPYTRGLARRTREPSTANSSGRSVLADRLAAMAADAARHDRMTEHTLGDAAALDEIADAQQVYIAQSESDLTRFTLLVMERERLRLRNRALPHSLPALWVKLGQPRRGLELASSLTDSGDRARALAEMAGTLAKGDQLDQFAQLVQDAERVIRSITDAGKQAAALSILAAALATARQFDRAERTARRITDPRRQGRALCALAAALATAGQLDEAKRVALSIRDPGDHTQQLAALAAALAAAGQLSEAIRSARQALRAARGVSEAPGSAEVFADLARALAAAGQLDLAEQVARSIKDTRQRAIALAAVAVSAEPGQAERATRDAEQIARSIASADDQPGALAEVAGALAAAGRLDQALQAALEISDPRHQVNALTAVAAGGTACGQPDRAERAAQDAEQVAQSIAEPLHRAEALTALGAVLAATQPDQAHRIARDAERAGRNVTDPERTEALAVQLSVALATVGQLEEARRAAQTIIQPRWQAKALTALAAALAVSEPRQSEQTAHDAECAARSIAHPQQQAEALTALAISLAITLPGQAERIALSITNPLQRAGVLGALAAAHTAADNLDHAERIAISITNPVEQAGVLGALAAAHTAAGNPGQAERLSRDAERIAADTIDRRDKTAVLAALVTGLGASQPTTAENIANSISDPRVRAETLARLAAGLADVGNLVQAERIARSISYPRVHADALATLAASLVAAEQPDQAERVASDAAQAARDMAYRSAQAAALAALAGAHAARGRQSHAEQTARDAERIANGIVSPSDRAEALTRLSATLAAVGQPNQAERVANSIIDPIQQAQALAGLSAALTTVDQLDHAERVASRISDSPSQAKALLAIGSHYERTNRLARANHICGLILTTSSWQLAFPLLAKLDPHSLVSAFNALTPLATRWSSG